MELVSVVQGEGDGEQKGEGEGRKALHRVLGSHPRLGEKKSNGGGGGAGISGGGGMSVLSSMEQSHLRGHGGSEEEEELARLNREYEARFPGLRYVVWVNGRPREEIFRDMRLRIARGDLEAEEREGIQVGLPYLLTLLSGYLSARCEVMR
jgi:2-oxo-4-hydroxy-4-carboxy--5-ureidoimidazoline (OHCU) decarboxylase